MDNFVQVRILKFKSDIPQIETNFNILIFEQVNLILNEKMYNVLTDLFCESEEVGVVSVGRVAIDVAVRTRRFSRDPTHLTFYHFIKFTRFKSWKWKTELCTQETITQNMPISVIIC